MPILTFSERRGKKFTKKVKYANLKPDSKVIMYDKYFYRLKKCKKFTKKFKY